MALKSKSKVPELSGIPWGRRKSRSPKAKIPWLTPKEKPDTTNRRPPTHKIAVLAEGQLAETQALRLLERHGLILVTRNHRCRCGEIDLIMRQGKCFVFIEVKYRTHRHFGSASEAVNWHKQQKIKRTALFWLQKNGFSIDQTECRFDVVTIEGQEHHIEWHTNILVEG